MPGMEEYQGMGMTASARTKAFNGLCRRGEGGHNIRRTIVLMLWIIERFGGNLPVGHDRESSTETAGDCRTKRASSDES